MAARVAAKTMRDVLAERHPNPDWMADIPDEKDRREFLRDDLQPPRRRALSQPLSERYDYGSNAAVED